ncbi:MAG: N-acetylglucosamine-6-phosphate deacetylase [Paracoccaceae bacterium]|nr:N-acetylglucosamine-6-phosphate deacetylase [Paracoccaceae bacterium]
MSRRAYTGADVFDGLELHTGKAVLLTDGVFDGLCDADAVPDGYALTALDGGTLLPGFVDLQVNGGGGVMFNDETSVDGVAAIAAAHATTGTRGLLPTLITDTPDKTRAAVEAVAKAVAQGVPGVIGLHLEGPHLSVARKGAHDPALIRPMEDADLTFLIEVARRVPNLMLTVAPESVSDSQIAELAEAGVIVSLGHTDCIYEKALSSFKAGARCATHLFNAMSQLGSREPGLVGAALDMGHVSAGLIADGIHVHPASMRAALAAKRGPGGVFLVTDAMATAGSEITDFTLNGRRVLRREGRLTLEDGTLAGADLDLPTALSVMTGQVGVARESALAMATSVPAGLLRDDCGFGRFAAGRPWHGIYLDAEGRYSPLP